MHSNRSFDLILADLRHMHKPLYPLFKLNKYTKVRYICNRSGDLFSNLIFLLHSLPGVILHLFDPQ